MLLLNLELLLLLLLLKLSKVHQRLLCQRYCECVSLGVVKVHHVPLQALEHLTRTLKVVVLHKAQVVLVPRDRVGLCDEPDVPEPAVLPEDVRHLPDGGVRRQPLHKERDAPSRRRSPRHRHRLGRPQRPAALPEGGLRLGGARPRGGLRLLGGQHPQRRASTTTTTTTTTIAAAMWLANAWWDDGTAGGLLGQCVGKVYEDALGLVGAVLGREGVAGEDVPVEVVLCLECVY